MLHRQTIIIYFICTFHSGFFSQVYVMSYSKKKTYWYAAFVSTVDYSGSTPPEVTVEFTNLDMDTFVPEDAPADSTYN